MKGSVVIYLRTPVEGGATYETISKDALTYNSQIIQVPEIGDEFGIDREGEYFSVRVVRRRLLYPAVGSPTWMQAGRQGVPMVDLICERSTEVFADEV